MINRTSFLHLVAATLLAWLFASSPGAAQDVAPVGTKGFTMPEGADPSRVDFSGRLELSGGEAGYYDLLVDGFGTARGDRNLRTLPSLSIDLVQSGTVVTPANRQVIRTDHPSWEWIVGRGRAWYVPEADISVMSLPISLKERNANCVHNGLLTLSGRGEQLSRAFFQIGSETCAYLQFDMATLMDVSFAPARDDVSIDHSSTPLPTRPLAKLAFRDQLGHPEEVATASITALGFLRDGQHYVSSCPTRYGDHPFCDELHLPSYSFAKSFVAGLGAMRLEALYPGAMAAPVGEYVATCEKGWEGINLSHLLDMSTGRYGSRTYDRDERSDAMRDFFLADTAEEKTQRACSMFRRKADPGKHFVYQTSNTYLLGVAMDAYLAEKTGHPDADFFAELVVPIYERLGLSPLMMETSRTYDEAAQPFAGWGSILLRDDLVKLMAFLISGGTIDGERVLDPALHDAAMQRAPQDRGLEAVIPAQRYRGGFWAWNAGEYLGCRDDVFIPVMSGFGGLTAALLPNGDGYYYVSDGGAFRWARAAAASHGERPMCGR